MGKQEQLDAIEQDILHTLQCELKDAAMNLVFGKGNLNADIFFIGEAPGKEEDEQGIPFVGRAGKDLDALLQTIGLSMQRIYIANILKYRPPKNRDPTKEEMVLHTPYLIEQLKVIQPKVIITLGNFSSKFILSGCDVQAMKKIPGVSQLHGEPKEVILEGKMFTVIPMYHPAAMLYRPKLRSVIKEDFKKVAMFLGIAPVKEKEKNATLQEF